MAAEFADHSVDWWARNAEFFVRSNAHDLSLLVAELRVSGNARPSPHDLHGINGVLERLRKSVALGKVCPPQVIDVWRSTPGVMGEKRAGAVITASVHELYMGVVELSMTSIAILLAEHRANSGWRASPEDLHNFLLEVSPDDPKTAAVVDKAKEFYCQMLKRRPRRGEEYTLDDFRKVAGPGISRKFLEIIDRDPVHHNPWALDVPRRFRIDVAEYRLLEEFALKGCLDDFFELTPFGTKLQIEAAYARRLLGTSTPPANAVGETTGLPPSNESSIAGESTEAQLKRRQKSAVPVLARIDVWILKTLWSHPNTCSQEAIAYWITEKTSASCSRPNVHKRITRLEAEHGLVHRPLGPNGGYSLTDEGRAFCEEHGFTRDEISSESNQSKTEGTKHL